MKWLIIITILLLNLTVKAPERNFELESKLKKTWIKQYKEIEMKRFLYDIAVRESGNNWCIINHIGAIGLYQFMPYTLKDLGCELTPDIFYKIPWIFPPEMQNLFMMKLIECNTRVLNIISINTIISDLEVL